jgi:hypothetical protein
MFSYPQPESTKCAYPDHVPKSTLGYTTNNVYPGFPPKMADGRTVVASYQPEAVLNENLIKQAGIQSNWEYRRYLQQNGDHVMRDNFQEAANDAGYFQRFLPSEQGDYKTMFQEPKRYSSYQESPMPINGKPSDLKELYLSKEQLHARKTISVPLTQEELITQHFK